MIGYVQYIEWLAGGVLIALCSLWLAREVGMTRRRKAGVVIWVVSWAAAVTTTIVALSRAQAALSSVPPEDRIEALSRWVTVFEVGQTAGRVIVGVGCLACFAVWLLSHRDSKAHT